MTGEELKQWREKMGLSQPQFAELLEVHSMTISRWEREVQAIPPFLKYALITLEIELKKKKK